VPAQEKFKYGDLEITIDRFEESGDWQEYGIAIQAPGHPRYGFKIWHLTERDTRVIAQVLVYDLIGAYEDPLGFLQKHNYPSHIPKERVSLETNREFVRIADLLHDFLHQAHLDVYKDWALKPLRTETPIQRGPHEWIPRKKS
jgi:hypothetical protein